MRLLRDLVTGWGNMYTSRDIKPREFEALLKTLERVSATPT